MRNCTHYSAQILKKLELSPEIFESKKSQISNLIKIRPVGTELFLAGGRADVRTDITKLIIVFRNSANALKNDQEKDRRFVEFAHWKKKYCAVRIKTSTGDGTTGHNFALLICNIGYDQTDKMLYTECSRSQYMDRTKQRGCTGRRFYELLSSRALSGKTNLGRQNSSIAVWGFAPAYHRFQFQAQLLSSQVGVNTAPSKRIVSLAISK